MTIHNKTHLYMDQVSVDKVSLSVNNGEDILRIFWSSLRHVLSIIRVLAQSLASDKLFTKVKVNILFFHQHTE